LLILLLLFFLILIPLLILLSSFWPPLLALRAQPGSLHSTSCLIESSADRLGQALGTIGLVDEAEDALAIGLGDLLGGVAAGKQHAHVRIDQEQLMIGIAAGETRHGQIEDHQVDLARPSLVNLEGVLAVLGDDHAVAVALQDRTAQVANDRL